MQLGIPASSLGLGLDESSYRGSAAIALIMTSFSVDIGQKLLHFPEVSHQATRILSTKLLNLRPFIMQRTFQHRLRMSGKKQVL